eukprot:TRINITY_DN49955_c0_g1_i1.p1 TRINITY_DN49955_c0_g1~~TRINITY_DN49955_c0_g1_i1.p1  ORF type:complete len:142 (+),score=45.24 TRINITY_DN49955_c0_g1_i1:43-468(+)
MKMQSQAMPALIPTVKSLSTNQLSESELQKQMFLVKQLKTMLEKEKWKLARMLGEFHSRNRMRKMQEMEAERNHQKIILPPSYESSLARMQIRRRRLNNLTKTRDSTASNIGENSWTLGGFDTLHALFDPDEKQYDVGTVL